MINHVVLFYDLGNERFFFNSSPVRWVKSLDEATLYKDKVDVIVDLLTIYGDMAKSVPKEINFEDDVYILEFFSSGSLYESNILRKISIKDQWRELKND